MTMTDRALLVLLAAVLIGCCFTLRAIGTGKGRHVAPRGLTWDDDVPTAVIPRVPTEHAPPWDFQPAPVIEPAAITSGPPEPEPEAIIIAARTTLSGGLTSVRVAVLPPLPVWTGEPVLPPLAVPAEPGVPDYVVAAVGHGGDTDAWLESRWNRLQARQLLDLLAAEAVSRDG